MTAVTAILIQVSGVDAAAAAMVNPLRPVSPGDVNADPSHGFLVLIESDAELNENETEGPVAIGGDVRFRDYRVGLNNSYAKIGDLTNADVLPQRRRDLRRPERW